MQHKASVLFIWFSWHKIDLEEFVDLKSVSNYGWRVDIERLRSKYFVDMMRNKDDEPGAGPLPVISTCLIYNF